MSHTRITMDRSEYEKLRGVIRARAGVELDATRHFAVASRVARRAEALGLESAMQYMSYLQAGPTKQDELDEMLRLATISQTSFNRYPRQLEHLERSILPELIDARSDRRVLRVWSAGCSTGQEAFDLAAIVHRVLGVRTPEWDVRILATDISNKSLETGRQGGYSANAVRDLSPEQLRSTFEPHTGGYRVRVHIRGMVRFERHDLRDSLSARRLGEFDVICCRNVLCHFSESLTMKCLATLHDRLASDGVLLTGHRDTAEHPDNLFIRSGGEPSQAWKRA